MTQRTENIMTAIFEKTKAELAAYRCLCPLTAFFDDLELSGDDKNGCSFVLFPRRRRGKDMGRSIILLFTAFLVGVLKG